MTKLQLLNPNFYNLGSPFCENNGLLEFEPGYRDPEFLADWSFQASLYGEKVLVDHFLTSFPDLGKLKNYTEALCDLGGQIVEGPGLFPLEFCGENYRINADLWIYLTTVLMPSGGLVVMDTPHTYGDQKSRFLEERGIAAVHHVAIRVEDISTAACLWRRRGFEPMSEYPFQGDSLCQWFLQNSAGQIIELINRLPNNNATFECQNIGGLRLSEVA